MNAFPRQGLFAITNDDAGSDAMFIARCAAAIDGGAVALQYRDKFSTASHRLIRARMLSHLCRERAIPLIINDDVELAYRIGAAGVHLGRNDAPLTYARKQLGADAIIGVSCYNDLGRADAAAQQGAAYVAFGRFFASRTKPDATLAATTLLGQARGQLRIPVVAIGGITSENGLELIKAGADMLAVIQGVFGASDPKVSARAIANLFVHA